VVQSGRVAVERAGRCRDGERAGHGWGGMQASRLHDAGIKV
jgi:hypothetical protein